LIQKLLQQILPLIAQISSNPYDSDEVCLQKILLILGSMMFIAAHVFINGQQVSFRLGINSGPVIGGVIGKIVQANY
jgi:hypothetical protein